MQPWKGGKAKTSTPQEPRKQMAIEQYRARVTCPHSGCGKGGTNHTRRTKAKWPAGRWQSDLWCCRKNRVLAFERVLARMEILTKRKASYGQQRGNGEEKKKKGNLPPIGKSKKKGNLPDPPEDSSVEGEPGSPITEYRCDTSGEEKKELVLPPLQLNDRLNATRARKGGPEGMGIAGGMSQRRVLMKESGLLRKGKHTALGSRGQK